ncbi:DUF4131 domain-containing protein [Rhodobacterales bacterium HKCCE2091]|nr:DUF4131 domain-containing protein [Rhodobacterales bacterium HKCCE2091]
MGPIRPWGVYETAREVTRVRPAAALNRILQGQRGALMPWAPVFLGLGVVTYFAFPHEPGAWLYALALVTAAAAAACGWRWREALAAPMTALACFAIGIGVAGFRAHSVAGPVLDGRYYGPIEGRIVDVDRSGSDALRLTLDAVHLPRIPPGETPHRVRVSLFGDQGFVLPEPGARIMLTGSLSPPEGPAEPGGFDFQRHAWFLQLGAVGYTRTPVVLLEPRPGGAHALNHLRLGLGRDLRDRIAGQSGAFAAAVTTGDRSGLSPETLAAMRGSNIAHLLAISGLHMGLLSGFVYAALRIGLAAIPPLALRFPIRKWAAAGALAAGAFYLALSGGNVATERAFVQVAVMLTAVMLDRRAITLRSVAIAATIVLLHRPETLLGPGFQMSFAATAALVAVFGALRGATWLRDRPGWLRWLFALFTSSAVAGAATAPFSASQFNMISAYGLAANLVAVPIMGSVVVPAAVVAALLAPLGLAGPALEVMDLGLSAILAVAERVSGWPGAVRAVATPGPWVMPMVVLGGLFAIIWRGRARWAGAVPVVLALMSWPLAERPALLVAPSGGLVGLMTSEGRTLSRPRGDGFVAGIWLENDGDAADQDMAAARAGWVEDGAGQVAEWDGLTIWHGAGRRAAEDIAGACLTADLVIANSDPPDPPGAPADILSLAALRSDAPGPCLLLTPALLRQTGAIAIGRDGRVATARGGQGERLWSSPEVRRAWHYDP